MIKVQRFDYNATVKVDLPPGFLAFRQEYKDKYKTFKDLLDDVNRWWDTIEEPKRIISIDDTCGIHPLKESKMGQFSIYYTVGN